MTLKPAEGVELSTDVGQADWIVGRLWPCRPTVRGPVEIGTCLPGRSRPSS